MSAAPLRRGPLLPRIGVALLAVALVAGALSLLAFLVAAPPAPPPVKNPFGVGMREAAPQASGLGGWILAVQGEFFRTLRGAVSAMKADGSALWSLVAIGFAYGVFHAAGPGHGKAVIAAYLVSSERTLLRGITLSLAAALLQALVAVGLVLTLSLALNATAAAMERVTGAVETLSFTAVAGLGAWLVWRKAGKLLGVWSVARDPAAAVPADASCDHVHLPPPDQLERLGSLREMAGVVIAAGVRPCAGAIVVLVFALSQGLLAGGVAATFAMAFGTALTTGALAVLAVFFKRLALRAAGGRGAAGALAAAGLELAAAAFVLVLGASLLVGLWRGAGGA